LLASQPCLPAQHRGSIIGCQASGRIEAAADREAQ
jgi:hypothetical protein